jgi:putative addiction module antidote
MMRRKVFKTGNSLVVSLPKDALDALGIQEGTDVSVDLDKEGRQIIITPLEAPLASAGVYETFARQVADFIEQYRPALEALARE